MIQHKKYKLVHEILVGGGNKTLIYIRHGARPHIGGTPEKKKRMG